MDRTARSSYPDEVVIKEHVAARLRERRKQLGLSQTRLAEVSGTSFQQVQKYEKATNRITASRLFEFAKLLDVPIEYFYGTEDALVSPAGEDPQSAELLDAWLRIEDSAIQLQLQRLLRTLVSR